MMHLIINDLYKLKENQNIIREENIDKLLNYNYRFITDINRGAMVFYQNDISLEEKEFLRKEIYLIDKVAKGKFNIKNMPKSIYQIKHNTNNYLEFQIEKSRFTIGKFMRELERSMD